MMTLRKTGRCATGSERDGGVRYHAVPIDGIAGGGSWAKALCGSRPGDRGNGWSVYQGDAVTCPACLRRLPRA